MANDLVALGISTFYEQKIKEYNLRVITARELNKEPELMRFIIMLRRLAKSQGKNIDDFI
jgi:hypothetical protein